MHFYGKDDCQKKRKKLANVCQHKNMCIPVLNMHTNVCNIRKLLNPFNWFHNTLIKLVLQYSRVMSFNKGYEIF